MTASSHETEKIVRTALTVVIWIARFSQVRERVDMGFFLGC